MSRAGGQAQLSSLTAARTSEPAGECWGCPRRLPQPQEPQPHGDRSILEEPPPALLPSLLLDEAFCKHKPPGES